MDLLIGTLLAAGLFLIALWGLRNVANLPSPALSTQRRLRKQREIRRGAYTLMALAVVVMVGVLIRLSGVQF